MDQELETERLEDSRSVLNAALPSLPSGQSSPLPRPLGEPRSTTGKRSGVSVVGAALAPRWVEKRRGLDTGSPSPEEGWSLLSSAPAPFLP